MSDSQHVCTCAGIVEAVNRLAVLYVEPKVGHAGKDAMK